MFTKLITVEKYVAIFTEMLLNNTSKVTKISKGSVNSGIAYGVSKLAQKTNKDIAVIESHIFPDSAVANQLDEISNLEGTGKRFGSKQSSTYVLVVGNQGTTYSVGVHTFISKEGIVFDPEAEYIIGEEGFGYIKVRSRTTGSTTKVEAGSINSVNPVPQGHNYVVNEYIAQFGIDQETDDVFRKRIKEGANILATSTISSIEQVFMKINENILKVYYSGIDDYGRTILRILTENGIDLNDSELNDILLRAEKSFGISDLRPSNFSGYGIALKNAQWQPIDISLRVDIEASYPIDEVRKEMQIKMGKYLDYRYWRAGGTVEWDNLLEIAKSTEGVKYVNDAYFFPSTDIQTDIFKLPRIRGFRMLDLNGNLLKDVSGNLNPTFYPQNKDFSYQAAVLQTI